MKDMIETWESNFKTLEGIRAITWMNMILSKATEHITKDGGFHLEIDIDMKSPSSKWKYWIKPIAPSESPIEE